MEREEEREDEVQEQEEVQAQERREPSAVAGTVDASAVELRENNGARSCVAGLLDHLFSFRAALGETLGGEGLGVEMPRRRAEVVRRDERRGVGASFGGGAETASGAEGGGGATADWLKLLFRLAPALVRGFDGIAIEESIAVLLLLPFLVFTRRLRPAGLAGSLRVRLIFDISGLKAVRSCEEERELRSADRIETSLLVWRKRQNGRFGNTWREIIEERHDGMERADD
jgi:hypothetical protein